MSVGHMVFGGKTWKVPFELVQYGGKIFEDFIEIRETSN
jgi:hypothetical protein